MTNKSKINLILIFVVILNFFTLDFYKNTLKEKFSHLEQTKFEDFLYYKEEKASYFAGEYSFPRFLMGKDVWGYLINANYILKNLNNDKKILSSQPQYQTSFLQPNIIAIYAYFTKQNIFIEKNNINFFSLNINGLVFFQLFFFYIAILFLYLELKKFNQTYASVFCSYLLIEPSIMQWNFSLMTESFFISFIILIFLLIIKKKIIFIFLAGIFLGLAFLQRTIMFYSLPIFIFYFFLDSKDLKNKIIKIIFFLIGFLIILNILLISNFQRSGAYYIMPIQAKIHIFRYLENKIIRNSLKTNKNMIQEMLEDRNKNLIKKNKINLDLESDRIKYFNLLNNESIKTVMKYPLTTIYLIIKKIPNTIILNPQHMYLKYNKYSSYEEYKESKDSIINIYLRFIYSFIFYIVCLIGLIQIKKKIFHPISILSILLIIFFTFFGAFAFSNNERYFIPALFFLGVFFSNGIMFFLKNKNSLTYP